MIRLVSMAKAVEGRPLFRPTTLAVPTDRRVGILGRKSAGKTALLHILAGSDWPDSGVVDCSATRSPVVNSGGIFHPQLSGYENLRFLARSLGVGADELLAAAHALNPIALDLVRPWRTQPAADRRALEAATVTMLPFDCYLYDDATQFEQNLISRCFEAVRRRGAGAVFATANPRFLRRFADFAIVIRDATLHAFDHVEDGIEFFD
jgi:capsular polysaccharide transport system ATP-binding protein